MLLWLAPLTRRLWLLSKTADQFGAGDLRARLPASRWSYISTLEQSFNQMAQQIEQLMADNQLLASSLSHDLRTPIACFRFGLDAALDATTPAQKDHYLSRLEQDLDRMEAMVNAFLEYASIDRQHQHGVQQPVDVQQLVEQAIQSCEPLTHTRHLTTQLLPAAQPLPLIDGHPHWLYRVLLNLLQNAQRYARQTIKVQLWSDDKHCFIRIQDDGPGIASADAARIFLTFCPIGNPIEYCATIWFRSGDCGQSTGLASRADPVGKPCTKWCQFCHCPPPSKQKAGINAGLYSYSLKIRGCWLPSLSTIA